MADDYGAQIAPAEVVVHRDKQVSRATFLACALMALFFGAVGVGGLISGTAAGLFPLAIALGSLFLALTRSVCRTVVTRDDVRVHWGLWGPRIPIQAIEAVRLQPDATRLTMTRLCAEPGTPRIEMFGIYVAGKVLDITWRDPSGARRRALIGAADGDALLAAIESVRGGGARIAGDAASASEAAVDEEALAEDEAAAGLEAARGGTRRT